MTLMLAACSSRPASFSSAPPDLREVLARGNRLNWYVRAQRSDSTWIEGRLRDAAGIRFRVGDASIEPAEITFVLRRDDARGLRDWKPFAAAAGVGGLTGIFAEFLVRAMLSDAPHSGSDSARWFLGGSVAGVVGLFVFNGNGSDPTWVQEWPVVRN